jgi:hypothetical protein
MIDKELKKITGTVVYWGDFMLSGNSETLEEEYNDSLAKQLAVYGLYAEPKFVEMIPEIEFDVLFFDYGGLLPGCESLIQSNYRWLLDNANEHMSRMYVMASRFTKYAMLDICMNHVPPNIYLTVKDFSKWYKGEGE